MEMNAIKSAVVEALNNSFRGRNDAENFSSKQSDAIINAVLAGIKAYDEEKSKK